MTTSTTITIVRSAPPSIWRTCAALLSIIAVIGVGALLDSSAMQWAGFIVWGLMMIGIAKRLTGKDVALTIPEARRRLDEIEAEEAGR